MYENEIIWLINQTVPAVPNSPCRWAYTRIVCKKSRSFETHTVPPNTIHLAPWAPLQPQPWLCGPLRSAPGHCRQSWPVRSSDTGPLLPCRPTEPWTCRRRLKRGSWRTSMTCLGPVYPPPCTGCLSKDTRIRATYCRSGDNVEVWAAGVWLQNFNLSLLL